MALSSLALYSSIPYAPALLLLGITLILVALVIATTGECILPKKETWVDYHITRHSGLWKKLQVSEDDERKIDALIAQFGNNILFQIHAQNAYRKRLPLNIPKHTRGTTVCDLELVLNNWIKIPINCWTVVH